MDLKDQNFKYKFKYKIEPENKIKNFKIEIDENVQEINNNYINYKDKMFPINLEIDKEIIYDVNALKKK